jgi:hypothetical protein
MSKKLIYLVSFVLVLGLAGGVANAAPLSQSPSPDGIVSVEAEHFDDNIEVGGHKWEETGPTGGFTGVVGMWAPEGRGGHSSNYAANSERLDYEIDFVKTGTYYPWILAWGADGTSDTCHVGLDGQEIATCDQMVGWDSNYRWSNDTRDPERASFEVTSTGVHTLNIWVREDGLIIDKIVLTTNPDYTLSGTEPGPPESIRGPRAIAFEPSPADGATDVQRDAILSWTAGDITSSINGHKLYFSENIDDVRNGVGAITLTPSSYAVPQRLEFATTYYWRVDEITPDGTVFDGSLWSFTTELFAYPIQNVTATASSSSVDKGPENAVNGSGLDSTGLLHGNQGTGDMWLSDIAGPQPTWILFEFDNVYKLHEMWVWNSNESLEPVIGLGFKDVVIEYSGDGVDFVTLGTTHEFARGTGLASYAYNTTINMGGAGAKFVRLTANSNWEGLLPQFGLSEVRFLSIPVQASEPNPSFGAFDVALALDLAWRSGREADKHDVYFSDDRQAVVDGTSPVTTVSEASHGPLSLDLGKTYFWRVNEVNDTETPSMWPGEVWSFATIKSLVLDDFESYNDLDPADPTSNRIFNAWLDGYDDPSNGSIVGYSDPPFAEQSIIHGGRQSMPLFYDNSVGNSEATLTLSDTRNWTRCTLRSMVTRWFITRIPMQR